MSDLTDDRNWTLKLEEFARLELELDRRAGSLTGLQLFMLISTFVILIVSLGLMTELFFGGSPFALSEVVSQYPIV